MSSDQPMVGKPDRRAFYWERVRTPLDGIAAVIGTGFGSGFLPKAPGTWGSLAAIPFCLWGATLDAYSRAGFWLLIFALGTWACKHLDELMKTGDNQNLVVDEFIGMGIATWSAIQVGAVNPATLFCAFIAFRFFDMVKPFPVRLVDQWSHRKALSGSHWWGGFGVMADDAVAGFQALLLILCLQKASLLG